MGDDQIVECAEALAMASGNSFKGIYLESNDDVNVCLQYQMVIGEEKLPMFVGCDDGGHHVRLNGPPVPVKLKGELGVVKIDNSMYVVRFQEDATVQNDFICKVKVVQREWEIELSPIFDGVLFKMMVARDIWQHVVAGCVRGGGEVQKPPMPPIAPSSFRETRRCLTHTLIQSSPALLRFSEDIGTSFPELNPAVLVSDMLATFGKKMRSVIRGVGRGNAVPSERTFTFSETRLVVLNFLIPLLDLAHFYQTQGHTGRLHNSQPHLELHDAGTGGRNVYVFQAFEPKALLKLFSPRDSARCVSVVKYISYFKKEEDPVAMRKPQLLEAVTREKVAESAYAYSNGKTRRKEQLCAVLENVYARKLEKHLARVADGLPIKQGPPPSVKAFSHVHVAPASGNRPARPFTVSVIPGGDSVCTITVKLHVAGKHRTSSHPEAVWMDMHMYPMKAR